jgi:hypothetical protein
VPTGLRAHPPPGPPPLRRRRAPRVGHFARTAPRGLARGESYGDTVETILARADNATLDVTGKILGLPAANLPRNTHSEMYLFMRFGGRGVALANAAHVGVVDSAIRFHSAQDARVRSNSHEDVPMESTMNGRLGTAISTAVSRRPSAPDRDGDDNKPMWSLELASA